MKSRQDENFPVGSLLIPKALRKDIHTYYRFARLADDIADSASLSPQEKLDALAVMDDTLTGKPAPPAGLHDDLSQASQDLKHRLKARRIDFSVATDLLIAFRMDAENRETRTWADLIDYCRFSACPVGRFLLALHGEEDAIGESDALCCALQILNHIQDAKEDFASLGRSYIPQDWLRRDGGRIEDVLLNESSGAINSTLTRMLEHTRELLARAKTLPGKIQSYGLAAEASFCLSLANRLIVRLERGDPVATTIKLRKVDWILSGLSCLPRLILK